MRDARQTGMVEAAIVRTALRLGGVDPTALADAPPPGVVGRISFAGGRGGDDHEHICSGVNRVAPAAKNFGAANQLRQLWLYAANDHVFPPTVAHRLFEAYTEGSKPVVRFVELPPFDGDGHRTFGFADPAVCADPVATFLAEVKTRALYDYAGQGWAVQTSDDLHRITYEMFEHCARSRFLTTPPTAALLMQPCAPAVMGAASEQKEI